MAGTLCREVVRNTSYHINISPLDDSAQCALSENRDAAVDPSRLMYVVCSAIVLCIRYICRLSHHGRTAVRGHPVYAWECAGHDERLRDITEILLFFSDRPPRGIYFFFSPDVLSAHAGLVPARFSDYCAHSSFAPRIRHDIGVRA